MYVFYGIVITCVLSCDSIKKFDDDDDVCRYVVMVCGKKAIHEALITKSVDFADRPEFYSVSLTNPNAKGCGVSCYHCISVACTCV